MRVLIPTVLLVAAPWLHGQTLTEYGAAAGRVTAVGGASKGISKSTATIMGKVQDALDKQAGQPKLRVTSDPEAPAAASTPAEKAPLPEASAIPAGLDRKDLIERLGKPYMNINSTDGPALLETCWFKSGTGTLVVTLRDGKVSAVSVPKPAANTVQVSAAK